MRKFHSRQPFADPQIQMVHRASFDANQNLVFAKLRFGDVFVTKNFGPAEFVNANSFHAKSSPEIKLSQALSLLRLTSLLRHQIICLWTYTSRSSSYASRDAAAPSPPSSMYAGQFLRLRQPKCWSATMARSWALWAADAWKLKSGKRHAK